MRCRKAGKKGSVGLSPAAKSLLRSVHGRSALHSADTQLRASYGHRTPAGVASPLPSPAVSAGAAHGLFSDMTPEWRPAKGKLPGTGGAA